MRTISCSTFKQYILISTRASLGTCLYSVYVFCNERERRLTQKMRKSENEREREIETKYRMRKLDKQISKD